MFFAEKEIQNLLNFFINKCVFKLCHVLTYNKTNTKRCVRNNIKLFYNYTSLHLNALKLNME
uniref:Uncharacterized protein n=1 Tax=Heterorhabditis bacteriophora TaxID=37862 RepID=A0A1I7WAC5_HETBA